MFDELINHSYVSGIYFNSLDYILMFIWSTVALVARLEKEKLLECLYTFCKWF